MKSFLIDCNVHVCVISSAFPGLLPNPFIYNVMYRLGSSLLQHPVHDRFLFYSSIFTQCLLNDAAEEQQAVFPHFKSFPLLYTKPASLFL